MCMHVMSTAVSMLTLGHAVVSALIMALFLMGLLQSETAAVATMGISKPIIYARNAATSPDSAAHTAA